MTQSLFPDADQERIEEIARYLHGQAEHLRCNTFYPSWAAIRWLKDSAVFLRSLVAEEVADA